MKASPVRIDAETEPEIRAVVLREDALRMVVVEVDALVGCLAFVVFDGEALETAVRIADGKPARQGLDAILNERSVKPAAPRRPRTELGAHRPGWIAVDRPGDPRPSAARRERR